MQQNNPVDVFVSFAQSQFHCDPMTVTNKALELYVYKRMYSVATYIYKITYTVSTHVNKKIHVYIDPFKDFLSMCGETALFWYV